MRRSLIHLILVTVLIVVLTGCAHQPTDYADTTTHAINCAPTNTSPDNRPTCHQHDRYDEVAGLFGYIIFRVVVEGIVHALVYR